MKIKTNTKNNASMLIPDTMYSLVVNQKAYSGFFNCFRTTLKGKRLDNGTIVTIFTSDNNSRTIVLQDGKLWLEGVLQNIEYEYVTPTYYDTNGNFKGMGVVV